MNPPFCPYAACPCHLSPPSRRWWRRAGFHHSACFGRVARFRCRSCLRTFSTQTFSPDFYAKRRLDYRRIEAELASSSSVRSLARNLGASCGCVQNRIDRLGRQAIACHAALRPLARRREDVCIDGFVGFDLSQNFPNNITISITSGSRYVLGFTHATVRRSGTLRPAQRLRRDELYRGFRFEPRAIERSFRELLDQLGRDRPPGPRAPLVVVSDEKLEYERAFKAHRLFKDQDADRRVARIRVASKLPRTWRNPLFASNYLDREIRKDQAAHRRESTCFGRSVANGLMRMACYVAWRNYAKRFLVKAPAHDRRTHAEAAGIPGESTRWAREEMFGRRAFLSRLGLGPVEERIWRKSSRTPLAPGPAPLPAYALA